MVFAVDTCSALPAIQLVYQLVALQNITHTSVNYSPEKDEPVDLPQDYSVFIDARMFKINKQFVTWMEAKNLCAREGAYVAVVDSANKLRYFNREFNQSSAWVHAGIIRVQDTWVNLNTGFPTLTIPWHADEPSGESDCAQFQLLNHGIVNRDCDNLAYYACEIPIFTNGNIITAH